MPDVRLQDRILQKLDCIEVLVASIDARLRDAIPPNPRRLYTRKEAAGILKVTTRTVDRRIRAGAIEVVRKDRSVRVVGASIDIAKLPEQSSGTGVLRI